MQRDPLQTAVVFAGGKSSRMGRDKALLPFGAASSLAALQYQKLQTLFERVYLSAKTEKFNFDAPVILDRYPESSPMVALASLFEILQDEAVLILSVDMPLIGTEEIACMRSHYLQQSSRPEILIAQSPRGLEPLFGIYHRTLLPHIQRCLAEGTHRMRALLDHAQTEILPFENAAHFTNINTPQEYRATRP